MKNSARRGQVATEFFIYSSIFLVIVLAAYFTIFFIQSAEVSNKESLYVKWFGERFASHMATAMSGEYNFNHTMTFDKSILAKPYQLYIKPARGSRNGFVFITWSSTNATYAYPIGNMPVVNADTRCITSSDLGEGQFYTISPDAGVLNFYNTGNEIIISQFGRCP